MGGSDWILHFQRDACQFLNVGCGHGSVSQNFRRNGRHIYHRGGQGRREVSAVQYKIKSASEFGKHVGGGGERGFSAHVRAGGGYGRAELGDDLPGSGMVRDTEADGVQSAGDHIGYLVGLADHYRQLAGPERLSKADGDVRDVSAVLVEVARVGDEDG